MAEKKNLLDVWIVDLNRVYKDVPFAVVADWLQQGRLLPEDRVRPAGSGAWQPLTEASAFAPYLPKQEPFQAGDQAEALEPVDLGFHWKRPGEEEDDDVDMIPLIDISLVLLIFFMMTASVSSGLLAAINLPGARHQLADIAGNMVWIGIDKKDADGKVTFGADGKPQPWFSFGLDMKELHAPTPTWGNVKEQLAAHLAKAEGLVKLRIRADRELPVDVIRDTIVELQALEGQLNRQRDAGQSRLTLEFAAEVMEPSQ